MITTEQIKELRDETGVSVMQCKKALEEAEGNKEKALMILKQKSSAAAAKKADREASEGAIVVKTDGGKAAVVELYCETDFVARNEDFTSTADAIAGLVLAEGTEAAREKATDLINGVIQKLGENIRLGTVDLIEAPVIGAYVHAGKTAAIVTLEGGDESMAKDIAMHVAAMKPEYLSEADVPAEAKTMATELFQKEVDETDKPADIKEKMLQGKLSTYFAERTLLEQPFVKSPDKKIKQLLAEGNATVTSFTLRTIGA